MTQDSEHDGSERNDRLRVSLTRVQALAQEGKWQEAASLCRSVLARDGDDAIALNMLGAIGLYSGQLQEAEDSFRRAVTLSPANADLRHNLGTVLLAKGDKQSATECFEQAARIGGSLRGRIVVCENSRLDPTRALTGTPYVHTLSDVLVETSYWTIIDGDRIYSAETVGRNLANNPFARYTAGDYAQVVMDLPETARSIEEPCIFVGGDEFYAHWLLRNLIRLVLIEDKADLRDLPLLVNEEIRPYQRQSLALLGYDESRLIRVPRGAVVACSQIHVPTQLRTSTANLAMGIDWLRRRVLPQIQVHDHANRRLFVTRRDAPQRHLTNESDIVSALAPFDFDVIAPGDFDFATQVRYFAEAEIVVGAHGAGLTNLVFSPPDCRVVELASRPISHMNDFRMIAESLGQKIETLISDDFTPLSDGLQQMHADFRVDPITVKNAVASALSR